MKIRSILALTDLSVDADRAVRRAARLAADHGAELRLLHLSTGTLAPNANPLPRLQRRARRLARQHGFAVDVVAGAAASVDDVARHRERADLIVLHDPRRSLPWPFRGRRLTERLADRTGLPVLAVGPSSALPYARVTVGVDLRSGSAALLEQACRFKAGARIEALHVLGTLRALGLRYLMSAPHVRHARLREARRHALRALQRLAAQANARDGRVVPAIGFGAVASGILARQSEVQASLTVVGAGRRARGASLPFSSVARNLLDASTGDVLLVPEPAVRGRRPAPAHAGRSARVAGAAAHTG
ncbi:MAG: universal stress protein [Burkholderiaceae bacterium]|nr:universal stress protein [Burkholderiaceae bacterium]